MSFVLDTCVLSELVRPKPEPAVVEWVETQAEDRLYLSALTLGEIEKGIAKLKDARRKEKLRTWLEDDLRRRFAGRWIDVTPEIARIWGRIQGEAELAGRKIPVIDGLIAASALHLGFRVVTRNEDHFRASGVEVVDPWPSS